MAESESIKEVVSQAALQEAIAVMMDFGNAGMGP